MAASAGGWFSVVFGAFGCRPPRRTTWRAHGSTAARPVGGRVAPMGRQPCGRLGAGAPHRRGLVFSSCFVRAVVAAFSRVDVSPFLESWGSKVLIYRRFFKALDRLRSVGLSRFGPCPARVGG